MRLIQHIKASNLLSFGPEGLDLELQDLNVLIGPNGSGKSNFLEIFELLRSLPRDKEDSNSNLQAVIRRGGGPIEWIWKGNVTEEVNLETTLSDSFLKSEFDFYHQINFHNSKHRFELADEIIFTKSNKREPYFFYKNQRGNPLIKIKRGRTIHSQELLSKTVASDISILAQRRDPDAYPLLLAIGEAYENIQLYREWSFGRNTTFRTPQRADQRNDRLESDFSNLGMFLSRLRKDPPTKRALIIALQELYEGITDFEVITEGGTVQIFFTEGDFSIPATRLSDGTLRYLCLIALFLDPNPPPLICIEEPELGLHPDIMPKIADLLTDASKRTQLIITTHSDVLIDALSDRPESVLVCEKHEGQTQIKRLNKEDLAHWLSDYSLGQLWMRGEIGGKRW